jgi:hypothetical protein
MKIMGVFRAVYANYDSLVKAIAELGMSFSSLRSGYGYGCWMLDAGCWYTCELATRMVDVVGTVHQLSIDPLSGDVFSDFSDLYTIQKSAGIMSVVV